MFVGKVLKKLYPEVSHGQEKRAPVTPASRNPPEKVPPERVKGQSDPPETGEHCFPGERMLASGHCGTTTGAAGSFCSDFSGMVTSPVKEELPPAGNRVRFITGVGFNSMLFLGAVTGPCCPRSTAHSVPAALLSESQRYRRDAQPLSPGVILKNSGCCLLCFSLSKMVLSWAELYPLQFMC